MVQLHTIRTDRLYVKVAEQLRQLVDSGQLKAGQRFPPERELAEKLGVSRPVIREAMIALELSGLVEIRTGSGIYVTASEGKGALQLGDRGVGPFEILEVRYILEAEACALAAARISDKELEELRQAIDEMEVEEMQPDASEKADQKFHSIIAKACQNGPMASIVDWLWQLRNESTLSAAFLAKIREVGVKPSVNEHRTILQALAERNPERARGAMRQHIENATANAAAYFSQQESTS